MIKVKDGYGKLIGSEYKGKKHNERHKAKHHQGEHIVYCKHCHENAQNDEHVFHKVHDNVSEHHGDSVSVICNSCHELTDGYIVQL